MKITVVGLGKLGLPLLAVLANSKFSTHGYDKNLNWINQLSIGGTHFDEPQLSEMLLSANSNISYHSNIFEACKESEIIFIIVPTPSGADGKFSNEILKEILENLAEVIRTSSMFQVINIVSTVMPGSCERDFIPLIEKLSGKSCGTEFGLTYNPEFIALGSVIKNMQYPDMHLIGASDERSGRLVSNTISRFVLSDPQTRIMNLTEAELVKISVNNFVTMKISFANMMMQICDSFLGTNVDVVTEAIGLDSRIGSRYLKAGTSYGGPCFPRDTRALDTVLRDVGIEASIPAAVDEMNSAHTRYVSNQILELLETSKQKTLLLVGLAYKENTKVVEESASLKLVNQLAGYPIQIFGWDPVVKENQSEFPPNIQLREYLPEALAEGNVIAVLRIISSEDRNFFKSLTGEKTVFDPWRQFLKTDVGDAKLVQLGKS